MARWFVVLAVGLLGCPPFERTGPFTCSSSSDCAPGVEVCAPEGRCCAPKRCSELPGMCGDQMLGCGKIADCTANCASTEVCVGGRCECPMFTCARDYPGLCGERADGCGGVLDCTAENCGANQTCDSAGRCACDPAACGDQCGFCGARNATTALWCGGCAGEDCAGNTCEPVSRAFAPFCWGALEPFPDDPSHRFFPVSERGGLWLYSETEVFKEGEGDKPGCSRHARVRMLDATRTATFAELIASADFPIDRTCARGCTGYAGTPFIRGDGLEMFFMSSYPCYGRAPAKAYLATRASHDAPWSSAVEIPGIGGDDDAPSSLVLLPDDRTLVYARNTEKMTAAVRTSTAAGDTSFVVRAAPVGLEDREGGTPFEMNPMSISCDGRYLIYARSFESPHRWDVREARIASAGGAELTDPRAHSAGLPPTAGHLQVVAESPDCRLLFVRAVNRQFYATRVTCAD